MTERPRRTQADRTAATKAGLADAAIDVLVERGWAALTAAEVCQRAGVTRGAFHHHYDSLPALMADALRRLYTVMGPGERRRPVTDLAGLVDASWASIRDPRFKAVLEAWLAVANDRDGLGAEVGPVVAGFATLVSPERMAPTLLRTAEHRAFYALARETMLGLALGRATNGGAALGHEAVVLRRLRAEARSLDGKAASG